MCCSRTRPTLPQTAALPPRARTRARRVSRDGAGGWGRMLEVPNPPFARVASRTRTVAEHRAAVAALLGPMPAAEGPLGGAHGRVLAEAPPGAPPLPPFDNSAMDG